MVLWLESLIFNVFISNVAKNIGLENMVFPEIGGLRNSGHFICR